MAYFASCVKSDWSPDPDGLLRHAHQVAEQVAEKLSASGLNDHVLPLPLFHSGLSEAGASAQQDADSLLLKDLSAEQRSLLLKNSISPLPLHKTLVLLETLDELADERYLKHERLALAKALVFSISNLHFGPEVSVKRAKEDAPVVAPWLEQIQAIAQDLQTLSPHTQTEVRVHHADAREIRTILPPNSIDAVITSPPYPN